jgi:hypothetical protein
VRVWTDFIRLRIGLWQALVNMIVNLHVPLKVEEFFELWREH